jgi:hypothetical protein
MRNGLRHVLMNLPTHEEIGSNVNLLMLLKTSICGINLAIDPWGSKLITPLSTLTPLQN